MMKRGRPKKNINQIDWLNLITHNDEIKDTIKAMLTIDINKSYWRGLVATPPASILENVVDVFKIGSDFPLEVPFFITLHHISAWLLQNDVTGVFAGREFKPDLWTVILADSGAGKSESEKFISRIISVPEMPSSSSSAKFIDDLSENNKSLWVADEFAQLLKKIESHSHMEEMKEYILKLYDGNTITRRTKQSVVEIKDPALSILGMTVKKTFINNVSIESMLDGFAQRFQYVVADPDPDRPPENFPIYRIWEPDNIFNIRSAWDELKNIKLHKKYTVSDNAEIAFETSFRLLIPPKEELPTSFYRRIMFRGLKYALIYHILLKKESDQIDFEDMGWAGRICALHIQDAKWLLSEHNMPELERLVKRTIEVKERIESKENRPIKPRDIVQYVHGIRTVRDALAILSLIK